METATENKRGRPSKLDFFVSAFPEKEQRAAANFYYASLAIQMINMKENSFFVTDRGNIRRQGIAEQIGRMYDAELITDQDARELIKQCIADYEAGATVKEIEKRLRALREYLRKGGDP